MSSPTFLLSLVFSVLNGYYIIGLNIHELNMDEEQIFTGSYEKLFRYWQNETRVKKFLTGGTRKEMVNYSLNKSRVIFKSANWLDIGAGPGFIQKLNSQSAFRISVALDISFPALLNHQVLETQKIAGSFRFPPFRNSSFDCISSFFCFSDYPGIKKIFLNTSSLLNKNGYLLYVDYSKDDAYWKIRAEFHDPNNIIGNINLRSDKDFKRILREIESLNSTFVETMSFKLNSEELVTAIPNLPKTIHRKFLFVLCSKVNLAT